MSSVGVVETKAQLCTGQSLLKGCKCILLLLRLLSLPTHKDSTIHSAFFSAGYSASARIFAEKKLQTPQIFLYWHWT